MLEGQTATTLETINSLERKWKKALLIVPPTGKYIREERCQTPLEDLHTVALRPPMDLLYIAGALERDGIDCKVLDFPALELSWDDLKKAIETDEPDAVVLSITTPTLEFDMKAAQLIKDTDPNVVTISKGAHFIHLDRESLDLYPQLDIIMRGEYEETICELASGKAWKEVNGISFRDHGTPTRNEDRGYIKDVDSIAFPARHLIDNGLYIRPDTGEMQATIVTSRGCPFPCVFCLAQAVSGKSTRNRTPENVIEELKECIKLGINNFLFRSDLFTANKRWVIQLCKAIQEEGLKIKWACNSRVDTINEEMLIEMKKAGCWLVSFGVESGDPDMLEKMKKLVDFDAIEPAIKLCRKVGVKSSVYFLIGLPWENRQTFNNTKNFARKLDPDFIEFFYSYPFHGTDFYRIAVEEGLLKEGEFPLAAYNHPAIPTKYLTLEELQPLRKEALRSFYLRPTYIIRTLASNPSPKVLKNYIVFGFRQLRDLVA